MCRRCPDVVFIGRRCPDVKFIGRRCPDVVFIGRRCPDVAFIGRICPLMYIYILNVSFYWTYVWPCLIKLS
jgi:hypothetical protein